jgi:BirA family biotin operon repressor/biotin-[acetyl-CoA-carboxylase] ligase
MEFRLIEHDLVDSTSERAFAALAQGTARHGDVHVARGQLAGRGTRGARWLSPSGEGLYASVVLRSRAVLEAAALTMAAGLAARCALIELGLARVALKWPNDLLVDGAKICGCLAETRGLELAAPDGVLGIGINVLQQSFPAELLAQRAVTSLALCGVDVRPAQVLEQLLAQLGPRIERVERADPATYADYFHATGLKDARVRVLSGEQTFEGRWRGLSGAAGLELELDDGSLRQLRLEHVRALDAAGA